MKTKLLIVPALALAVAPVAFIGGYRWDSAHNHDLEFGYYGQFNRLRHALNALPGLTVTRDWMNADVTLEEFGFDVQTNGGEPILLDFQENDPARNLSGERLSRALRERIESKTSLRSSPE